MMLSFTLLLLLLPQPNVHQWVEVSTSDTTMVYSYDFSSIRTIDSTGRTFAWVKVAPKNSSLFKLHLFDLECSGTSVECDSEILFSANGSIVDRWSSEEMHRHVRPKSDPDYAAVWRPIWEVADAICHAPTPSMSKR